MQLNNKTALVCGASKGIGKATAIKLSEIGANVFILARNKKKLEETFEKLDKSKKNKIIICDLKNLDDLEIKISDILKSEKIDILINNTAGPKSGSILDANNKDFFEGINNHVIASNTIVKLLLPQMKKQKFGRIINVISTSVKSPLPDLGVSNTIRGAMANWAKTLSNEISQFGINVNNVLPGYTMTERLEELIQVNAQKNNKTFNQIKKEWEIKVPLKRFAEPIEIANVIAFLCTDLANYVNGTNITVDGGRTSCL